MEICDQKLSESSERTYCPELTYFNNTLLSYHKNPNKEPNSVTGVKFLFNLSLLYVILYKIPCYDNDYDYDHRSDSERSKQFENAKSKLHSIEHATKTKLVKIHKLVNNINPVFRFLSSFILISLCTSFSPVYRLLNRDAMKATTSQVELRMCLIEVLVQCP